VPNPVTAHAPLYDERFEHDACGVGFVADAGGRSAGRVLDLALSGLASLGHRGAFAADGESSDGAGVALPLERTILERLTVGLPIEARPGEVGILSVFLAPNPEQNARERRTVEKALAAEGLPRPVWREVPIRVSALGQQAAESMPAVAQALVRRPPDSRPQAFELALICARRRIEATARRVARPRGSNRYLSVTSASARTIVYKGLVAGDRLAAFYPDLAGPLASSYAIFHQRYATNTTPTWRLAQPFSLVAHNGEINTVRGNREEVRGRTGDLAGPAARRLLAAGPLLSPDGSDSMSLDEAAEALTAMGRSLEWTMRHLIPAAIEAGPDGRHVPRPLEASPLLAPWDGPAAIVFGDGQRVGVLVDRNGLRPAAFAVTSEGVVAVASEAGAVPLSAAETVKRGRLGPGEMLIVEPGSRSIRTEARHERRNRMPRLRQAIRTHHDRPGDGEGSDTLTPAHLRYLAGLDAERARVDIRTMVLEAHEPLWSMGDDTPTPARARVDRTIADHLRQSFAQVTNPAIDPERERIVMDLTVDLGRRTSLLGGRRGGARVIRLERPIVADFQGLLRTFGDGCNDRARRACIRPLDATWRRDAGPAGLARALDRLTAEALAAARGGRARLFVISDRGFSARKLPIPSALAVGAVHTALTEAGLRGRCDIAVEAADLLDVHSVAMALAVGASAAHPWLAIELARETAGGRGAEELTPEDAVTNLLSALDAGLRKVLARMGISTATSYIGGCLFEALDLGPDVLARCFPSAPAWPGQVELADLAGRQLRRAEAAEGIAPDLPLNRMPDPGLTRFRKDGEIHLYAPPVVGQIQGLADRELPTDDVLAAYRAGLARERVLIRDELRLRKETTSSDGGGVRVDIGEVEPIERIVRRFVTSAMSVGALSPEAHQAVTIGIQRAGGAANTGEGGEDPAWYQPGPGGERRDARIKQVASARFGVTATYLARAEQLEIKIAQGSKPGEGGQLPGRKATEYIASLRRASPGQSLISPPPHHDIYSIEDLAQLIADLRAINPAARIGVKLVATRGIGTIAAGVAKAGADYIHVAGHSGGTGASPLSSIKHAGVPWELGLAEVHQTLLRNGLRHRVVVRADGGLQTGRDLMVAALLGAEEFGFGTAALVALGCDMARQCHLDTCPTGIATQRADLRAKFTGTPERVERFARALAQDLRRELAAIGARSVGEVVGQAWRLETIGGRSARGLRPLVEGAEWHVDPGRRENPTRARELVARAKASEVEDALVSDLIAGQRVPSDVIPVTTADRSFGARLSGALERGEIGRAGLPDAHTREPIRLELSGSAGQSFGAFLREGVELTLDGQANDYVGKGLSGGTVLIRPERDLEDPSAQAIAGNTCLYGATAGRLHLVGRAGMRFAVRNSGAQAVVEGIGAHGCEYMTGGLVVILGPVGPNFGAGMTGGRAYLHDPSGRVAELLHGASVVASRLSRAILERSDGVDREQELFALLEAHRDAGSPLAEQLLRDRNALLSEMWLIEPVDRPAEAAQPRSGDQAQATVETAVAAHRG
jgi:glutamate synthase domain-containing protein 2/glutamate synthase domain-containing protein 1/glutamate synthase domain-containing protein 3